MQALPYSLPAAAAGLAYLNGRHSFFYDWKLLSTLLPANLRVFLEELRDTLNFFYVLEAQAQSSRRDHPWLIFNGKSWSYAQAYDIVLRYGTWLKTKGVQKDEVVAMDFVNSDIFVWVWFGIWSIGAKPAFLNYNLTGKPLIHSIRTSTAKLVLVDEACRPNFTQEVMAEHGFVAEEGDAGVPEGRQAKYRYERDPDQIPPSVQKQGKNTIPGEPQRGSLEIVFFDKRLEDEVLLVQPTRLPNSERGNQMRHSMGLLVYTSGTTGLPKPAVVSWAKVRGGAKFPSNFIPIRKSDILYTSMPLYHATASVLGVGPILEVGATICLSEKFSHKTFWPEIRASKATILQYVGETCRYLLSAPPSPEDKDNNIHTAFGNGLRPDVWQPFKDRFDISTICEFWSATESPSAMFNYSTNDFSAGAIGRNGTIAQLLLGTTIALIRLDPDFTDGPTPLRDPKTNLCQTVDHGEPGELLLKLDADNISQKFQGYFGNDKATNSKILRDVKSKGDAYFRTGDLMRWDSENRWWFVDRIGDTFRWKAENVSTAEVAEALGRFPAVEEANVYGVQVPRHDGRAGCAAVVFKNASPTTSSLSEDSSPLPLPDQKTLTSLAQHLKKELPPFAVPVWLRVTREMQKTGTNKHQKNVLQNEGIDPQKVREAGDGLLWLKEGTYQKFMETDLEKIQGGRVKL